MKKKLLGNSDYSRTQGSDRTTANAKVNEIRDSDEISLEEIERAKMLHVPSGQERFCDKYAGTEYCLKHCKVEECPRR